MVLEVIVAYCCISPLVKQPHMLLISVSPQPPRLIVAWAYTPWLDKYSIKGIQDTKKHTSCSEIIFLLLEAASVKPILHILVDFLSDISIFYPFSFAWWKPIRWPSLFWPMPSSISCSWIRCHVTGPLGIHGLRIKLPMSFHRIQGMKIHLEIHRI